MVGFLCSMCLSLILWWESFSSVSLHFKIKTFLLLFLAFYYVLCLVILILSSWSSRRISCYGRCLCVVCTCLSFALWYVPNVFVFVMYYSVSYIGYLHDTDGYMHAYTHHPSHTVLAVYVGLAQACPYNIEKNSKATHLWYKVILNYIQYRSKTL